MLDGNVTRQIRQIQQIYICEPVRYITLMTRRSLCSAQFCVSFVCLYMLLQDVCVFLCVVLCVCVWFCSGPRATSCFLDNDGVQTKDKTGLKKSTLWMSSFNQNRHYCPSTCRFRTAHRSALCLSPVILPST